MLDFLGSAAGTLAAFAVVLALVITIHELGHFGMAKLFGVRIDRFSIGFGRTLWSRRDKSGVEWRVGALPLGGYVKFSGDLDVTGVPDREGLAALRSDIVEREGPGAERAFFHFKPIWQRALIVAAGPLANFVLAVAIFTVLAMAAGEVARLLPRIGDVQPDSPAAAAGFQPGDLVTSVDGRSVDDWGEFAQLISLRAGVPVRVGLERGGAPTQLTVTPGVREVTSPIDQSRVRLGYVGLTPRAAPEDIVRHRYGPVEAVGVGVGQAVGILDSSVTYIGRILTGRESGDQLSGPIGIARASGVVAGNAVERSESAAQAARNLFFSLLTLAGLLSVGVGFLNLLPIPVLDGGHLVFYAYEAVARRPLPAGIQEAGFRVGLALLVGLMLFATWNDINKLNLFAFLGGSS